MGSMFVPLLGGVLWRRATPQGAIAAIIAGGTVGVISFLAGIPGPFQGIFNVELGLLAAYVASALAFVVVSLIHLEAIGNEEPTRLALPYPVERANGGRWNRRSRSRRWHRGVLGCHCSGGAGCKSDARRKGRHDSQRCLRLWM